MAHIDISQADLVERFIERLRRELGLSESTCYLVAEVEQVPVIPQGGPFFVTVCPLDGTFDIPEQAPEQCMERFEIAVSAYTQIATDKSTQDKNILIDAQRGLLPIKRLILKAMVGKDLADECEPSDSPMRSMIYATRASGVTVGSKGNHLLSWLRVNFGMEYDWDLTS